MSHIRVKVRLSVCYDWQMLLASETAKERETKKMNEEIQDLLNAASTKEQMMSSKFKSQGGMFIIYIIACEFMYLWSDKTDWWYLVSMLCPKKQICQWIDTINYCSMYTATSFTLNIKGRATLVWRGRNLFGDWQIFGAGSSCHEMSSLVCLVNYFKAQWKSFVLMVPERSVDRYLELHVIKYISVSLYISTQTKLSGIAHFLTHASTWTPVR